MSAANTVNPPVVFTQDELGWVSWIDPLPEAELTERHFAGLVDRSRAKSEYFRLLVRDPEVLEARTKTDKDIFYNTADGLPRAERELAAAATSRYNGCIYCASVHARFASTYSKRRDDVQRLLDEGVGTDLGERWNAVVKASVALAGVPHARAAGAGGAELRVVVSALGDATNQIVAALLVDAPTPRRLMIFRCHAAHVASRRCAGGAALLQAFVLDVEDISCALPAFVGTNDCCAS